MLAAATRRAINSIVARNKHMWEESQAPGQGSGMEPARGPPRRPSTEAMDLFGLQQFAEEASDFTSGALLLEHH